MQQSGTNKVQETEDETVIQLRKTRQTLSFAVVTVFKTPPRFYQLPQQLFHHVAIMMEDHTILADVSQCSYH